MAGPFFFSGSTSDDFDQTQDGDGRNLLPPCPDSPNCVRISKPYKEKPETVFKAALSAIQDMGAVELKTLEEPLRINAVFSVFIYKDDLIVLIEQGEDSACHMHLKSASRVGYSDLGVNRRRVKRFLNKLQKELK